LNFDHFLMCSFGSIPCIHDIFCDRTHVLLLVMLDRWWRSALRNKWLKTGKSWRIMVIMIFVRSKQFCMWCQYFVCGTKILYGHKFHHGRDVFITTEHRFGSELSSWLWWILYPHNSFVCEVILYVYDDFVCTWTWELSLGKQYNDKIVYQR